MTMLLICSHCEVNCQYNLCYSSRTRFLKLYGALCLRGSYFILKMYLDVLRSRNAFAKKSSKATIETVKITQMEIYASPITSKI